MFVRSCLPTLDYWVFTEGYYGTSFCDCKGLLIIGGFSIGGSFLVWSLILLLRRVWKSLILIEISWLVMLLSFLINSNKLFFVLSKFYFEISHKNFTYIFPSLHLDLFAYIFNILSNYLSVYSQSYFVTLPNKQRALSYTFFSKFIDLLK